MPQETYDELVEELLDASRALVGIAVRAVAAAPVDITVAQHRVLMLLAERGPQSVGEIADYLGVNPSNASRHCDRLERLDLVHRTRSAQDRRVVRIELSATGRTVLDAVTRHRREQLVRIVGRIPERDVAALRAALRQLNATTEEPASDQR